VDANAPLIVRVLALKVVELFDRRTIPRLLGVVLGAFLVGTIGRVEPHGHGDDGLKEKDVVDVKVLVLVAQVPEATQPRA
jgi:hypothetical protein